MPRPNEETTRCGKCGKLFCLFFVNGQKEGDEYSEGGYHDTRFCHGHPCATCGGRGKVCPNTGTSHCIDGLHQRENVWVPCPDCPSPVAEGYVESELRVLVKKSHGCAIKDCFVCQKVAKRIAARMRNRVLDEAKAALNNCGNSGFYNLIHKDEALNSIDSLMAGE